MIFLILPCNTNSGWGVCSTNLAREISQKTEIKYVSCEIDNLNVLKNPIELSFFKSCHFSDFYYLFNQTNYPIIQALQHDLSCYLGKFNGSFKIGICFSDRKIPKNYIEESKRFDVIISGSEWCKKLLEENGVKSKVLLQGIDPLLFNKKRSKKQFFLNDFVVFSGGKFEPRKGQDITVKAFKVLQDRHPDVKMLCCWHNPYTNDNGFNLLVENKIDLNKIIFMPNVSNSFMPQIYQNTDVGIFPSRCEAGTNLVMMEYMACGKPAIATVGTGQRDLINSKTGISISNNGICELKEGNEVVSFWEEPSVDSAIESLEWAYNNPSKMKSFANQGAKLLSQYTWKHMAESFLNLIP
jgi:glycosyltransferase involved in cell wall biosynthesis